MPKVIFKYSSVYDESWRQVAEFCFSEEKYFSSEKIVKYIGKVEVLWRRKEKKVLKELSQVTGLGWDYNNIFCYVVGKCFPKPAFSDPLTISVYKDEKEFIDVLVHEIIHQLLSQPTNFKKLNKYWEFIVDKYPEESKKTRIHILVHAIHKHIYLKLFNENRLKKDIKKMEKIIDYKKAWEIVQKQGYKNIINEMRKFL